LTQSVLDQLTAKLARVCGYDSAPEMYSTEVKDIMERYFLTKEYREWNKYSKERFKFEVIIKHCRDGVPSGLNVDTQVHRGRHQHRRRVHRPR
jgi:hypothetical protein